MWTARTFGVLMNDEWEKAAAFACLTRGHQLAIKRIATDMLR